VVSKREKILAFAAKQSMFRAGDIPDVIEPRAVLSRMVAQKELIRIGHGLYSRPEVEINENYSLVEAVKRYPGSVICLISAMFFHKIGTQMPYEIWLMRNDRKVSPKTDFPVRFVYSSGDAFTCGIEKHSVGGIEVNIYSPAKTIADCFKYRNKIGLDVAIEALHEGWKGKRFTMDELWTAVKACRAKRIIQPYLEMLVK